MAKKTFNRKEVIELIRFYCKHQRILCQLPVPYKCYGITEEINDAICKKIRVDADIERFNMHLNKEDFEWRLNEIKSEKHNN